VSANSLVRQLFGAVFVSCLGAAVQAQPNVQIIPDAPRYQEPVYVRITPQPFAPGNIFGASVSMNGTNIDVAYREFPEIGGNYPFDVELGRFPAGAYSVSVHSEIPGLAATAQFVVAGPERSVSASGTVPAVNYTDMWWHPAESGWGLNIVQGATNEVFATWFVYDQNGNPVWYTLNPGQWIRTNLLAVYTGPIFRTTGPYFGGTYDPATVGYIAVGNGTLTFRNFGNGTFTYSVSGVTATKDITRLRIE